MWHRLLFSALVLILPLGDAKRINEKKTEDDVIPRTRNLALSLDPHTTLAKAMLRNPPSENEEDDEDDDEDHEEEIPQENVPLPLLEFVHISMTGGTAITKAGWEAGFNWAACHVMPVDYIGCDVPDWRVDWIGPHGHELKFKGEPWHAPPLWLHPNPYDGRETFTVIRDPYDRVIGEYFKHGGYANPEEDPYKMNTWIKRHLKYLMDLDTFPGHFLPQHFTVFGENHHQAIGHIFRYETLHEEFNTFMRQRGLIVRLPPFESPNPFQKYQLEPDTVEMINALYEEDFRAFNYTMLVNGEQPLQD